MQLAAMADYEPRMLLKTISSAPAARRAGSHAGSRTDEQPWDAPDPCGQPGETSPRPRTDLNGTERPRWYVRIRRSSSWSPILPRRFRSSVAGAPCGPGRLAAGSFVMLAVLPRSDAMSGEPAAAF